MYLLYSDKTNLEAGKNIFFICGGNMSRLQKCVPIVVFLLFISVGVSRAEPTPTISYLMNTPVSMLDFGIYKLEEFLDSNFLALAIAKCRPITEVKYLYSSNRIEIKFTYVALKEQSKQLINLDLKNEIASSIKRLKYVFFALDEETGEPKQGCCSSINRFFSHQGYGLKNEPKNLGRELDQITEIYVEFLTPNKPYRCKSPLIGDKIYWEK